MHLEATSLKVKYIEPQITIAKEERDAQLTKFISLFAQIGFKELALNENFADELDKCCN